MSRSAGPGPRSPPRAIDTQHSSGLRRGLFVRSPLLPTERRRLRVRPAPLRRPLPPRRQFLPRPRSDPHDQVSRPPEQCDGRTSSPARPRVRRRRSPPRPVRRQALPQYPHMRCCWPTQPISDSVSCPVPFPLPADRAVPAPVGNICCASGVSLLLTSSPDTYPSSHGKHRTTPAATRGNPAATGSACSRWSACWPGGPSAASGSARSLRSCPLPPASRAAPCSPRPGLRGGPARPRGSWTRAPVSPRIRPARA